MNSSTSYYFITKHDFNDFVEMKEKYDKNSSYWSSIFTILVLIAFIYTYALPYLYVPILITYAMSCQQIGKKNAVEEMLNIIVKNVLKKEELNQLNRTPMTP